MISQFVTEPEYFEVLDDIKDLLKETYQISDDEAASIIFKSREKVDDYLYDYIPFINHIKDVRANMRETLDTHLHQTVDQEQEMQLKMRNDAAIWLTFECIRRYCKKFPY
jgi:hypothetical protein